MVENTTALELSKYLAKNLKEKGVKQSELLEIFAHFKGFSDWNTCSAVENTIHDFNDNNWSKEVYTHIDNGGIAIRYNPSQQLLFVNAGFFGYSDHNHFFHMSKKELEKLLSTLVHQKENDLHDSIQGNGWGIVDDYITISNAQQSVSFGSDTFSLDELDTLSQTLLNKSFKKKETVQNEQLDDDALFVVVKTLNGGYSSDQQEVLEAGLKIGERFEVSNISMGSSRTYVSLHGFKNNFNSVFFKFVNHKGREIDIFSMKKYNPYLG